MRSNSIVGVKVNFDMSYDDVLAQIKEYCMSNESHFIWTVNPEFVMRAQKDSTFKNVLNRSSISTPDGIGLIFADRYLSLIKSLPKNIFFPITSFYIGVKMGILSLFDPSFQKNRITGSDLLIKLASYCANNDLNMFFLGGWEKDYFGRLKENHGNIAQRAMEKLKENNPKLNIIGATSDYDYMESQDSQAISYIHNCMKESDVDHIDILLVGYGSKKQEEWLIRNITKIPAKVGIGVGASFDFIVGTHKRAPNVFKRYNIEWLFRLLQHPWRIKRILLSFPIFPIFIYKSVLEEFYSKNN